MDRRCFSETNFNNTPMRGLVHSQITARRLIVTAAVPASVDRKHLDSFPLA